MNVLNHHWCKATLLPQAVLKLWCPEILFSRILCMGLDQFCILPRMKESMALFHICVFYLCHFTLLLKRNLQHVSHKWIICRSHLNCSVGKFSFCVIPHHYKTAITPVRIYVCVTQTKFIPLLSPS